MCCKLYNFVKITCRELKMQKKTQLLTEMYNILHSGRCDADE